MEVKFESIDGEGTIRIKDKTIIVDMNKKTKLYERIIEELDKGVTDLKAFSHKGIPGKMKFNRMYRNNEDIIKLLRDLKREFYVNNIISISNEKSSSVKVIDIDELRLKKLIERESYLREFSDRYEYCIIRNYEERYDEFQCDSIQMEDVFVQLLTIKDKRILVSIDFSKDRFELKEIINWLYMNNVKLLQDDESSIANASSVIKGLKFKSTPVILYKRGDKNIFIIKDQLPEVTEEFIFNEQQINTFNSREIDNLQSGINIVLNGEEINYIPEIKLDLTKDLLISNGHIVVASYIGDYGGCIGYFEEEGYDLPVAWIHDYTKVYINIYEKDNSKIVSIDFGYSINIDEFM